MKKQLTQEIERKARELAKTVAASSNLPGKILPTEPNDEDYDEEYEFFYRDIILKVCRKSVMDGFPLQDFFLGEVPYGDNTGILAYFENIAEFGMGENYNPEAHEIVFWCPYKSKIAVPYTLCGDMGLYNEKRRNCFDAVYRIEHPQKSRRIIQNIIPKIRFYLRNRPYKRYFENINGKPRIRILAIADLHDWSKSELELINGLEYDCCCLLGDIPETALKIIKQLVHKPLYGILGNHDDLNSLSRYGITDLNGKAVTVNGVSIAGLSGSHRYKNGDYPMLTQKESITAATVCPAADILISHDTAYHVMKQLDNAHCGLKGISRYISRSKSGLNICGHYHINSDKRLMYKGCDILCVYKCALVSFPENTAKIIF